MKLLLTSSGIRNKSLEKALADLLGKPFKESKLVFVPTAANVEKGDKSWLVEDMNNFRLLGFSSLDVIDISTVPREIWEESFENADILVFGGGNVKYLLDWINKTGIDQLLPKYLETKVYVGISAGSMVTAETVSLTSSGILYYEETGNLESMKGLGFVDFEIRPHLGSEWFPKVTLEYLEKLSKEFPGTFYALDDESAVQVKDTEISVITEGKWKKFN